VLCECSYPALFDASSSSSSLATWWCAQPRDRVPSIVVQGLPGTGKSSVVQAVLTSMQAPFAYASCGECPTARLLFHLLLSQLSPDVQLLGSAKSCDRFADFVCEVSRCCSRRSTTYLVRAVVDGRDCCDHPLCFLFPHSQVTQGCAVLTGAVLSIDLCVGSLLQVIDEAERLHQYGLDLVECFLRLATLVRTTAGCVVGRLSCGCTAPVACVRREGA